MNDIQWKIFCDFRTGFKQKVLEWSNAIPELGELQKLAAQKAKNPLYPFETPVVYNSDLDKITQQDQIKLIVIGDNPGKDEQLAKNQRYLCGQAGKIADGFFKRNPELDIDFRKNVIILNKTPIHSAKTAQLGIMIKEGGSKVQELVLESQLWMAQKTAELHMGLLEACTAQDVAPELWLIGYSALKGNGFFVPYRQKLKETYSKTGWDKVFVYQHFSMNRFTIDLKELVLQKELSALPLKKQLEEVGFFHKEEIF